MSWVYKNMGIVLGLAAFGFVSLVAAVAIPVDADSPELSNIAPSAAQGVPTDEVNLDRPDRPWLGAKYVFFFIGDGMANVQIHAAEAYLEAENHYVPGAPKAQLLTMSQFPVQGMASTFADNRFITGSAAAGTALACGMKTSIGNISMAPDDATPYTSLAEVARDSGMKVGIVSSVSIDHATPAVFYAHQPSRSMYYEIGLDLANSGFDYFGGGGFKNPEGGTPSVWDQLNTNGYDVVYTREDLAAVQPGTKCVAINHTLAGGQALYYELDRPEEHMSLAEFTAEGIRLLDNEDGFFMMVEGGKIDWACHANDARSSIEDTFAFDAAIDEAMAFYQQHPQETLIVVTGDHECGGLTIGFAGTGYENAFELLDNQTMSYEAFSIPLAEYIATHEGVEDIDADMKALMLSAFGIDYDTATEYEQQLLEAAFDRTMGGDPIETPEEDYLLYGYYEPLTVTLTHILNRRAGLAWTSYSHTGVPVQVLAIGRSSYLFDGFYDNTDVALKIAQAMRITLPN